ncbi:MAG: TIR domain-containing protein [Pseudonocardiaceae bacterium]
MARVFLSHAGEDQKPTDDVHEWLLDGGHEVFLDRDMRNGIALGAEWEKRLHERLRWADAVVCVVTSAYISSVWCTAEIGIARSRGCRLLPVLTEPGMQHPLLASLQHVDSTKDEAAAREKITQALRLVDVVGGLGWPDDRSPYPGLRPFASDEHRAFFGRAREVAQLAAHLRAPASHVEGSVLLLVGPSGGGKSSLVRAGLLPVMAYEPGWWTLPPIMPGREPTAALARELAVAARDLDLGWSVADVRRQLNERGLTELVDDLLLAVPGRRRRRLLVVVDQFEELLTQTDADERQRFAELLRPALAGPVQMMATLRPEFLDQVLVSRELAALPTATQAMRPLQGDELCAVIEEPAHLAGIELDEGLATRLVADTGSGEALPLLAFTLAQLSAGVERSGRLLISRYEQLGGVQGALTRQAVGVAHEAFLSAWPPLANAIDAASSALRARRGIEQAADEWVSAGQPPERLWERGQLAAAWADVGARMHDCQASTERNIVSRWFRRRTLVAERVELSNSAREFLDASTRRDKRRRRRSTTVLSVLLVLAVAAAGVAIHQGATVQAQRDTAIHNQIASQADRLRAVDVSRPSQPQATRRTPRGPHAIHQLSGVQP